MADNRLVVEVLGDTAKLQSSLRGAEAQINQFARRTSKIKSTGADAFVREVQSMGAESKALEGYAARVDAAAARASSGLVGMGVKAGVAGLAVHALGQNMQELGGDAGKLGSALSDLTSLNLVGFYKNLQSIGQADLKGVTADLLKYGDAARATAKANEAAARGWSKTADAARLAATMIREATNASFDPTKVFDPIRGGALDDQVSGVPLPDDPAKRKGITASQRNAFFDAALARSLDRVQDADLRAQVTKLNEIAKTIEARIAITKDITRKLTLEDELAAVVRQRKGVEETIATNAQARAEALQIAAEELKREREARAKALEEARKIAIQSKQFRALGQAADGSDVVPGVDNLKKQLASLTDRLSGSGVNLSSKLESQLAGVRKVLSGQLGAATRESRSLIAQLFDTIRGEFDKQGKGPLTKTMGLDTKRIIEGLGLSTGQASEIRGRLSGVNSAGRSNAPVVESHVTVQLDGHTVGKTVTRSQQKRKKRNPTQRRGPNRGS